MLHQRTILICYPFDTVRISHPHMFQVFFQECERHSQLNCNAIQFANLLRNKFISPGESSFSSFMCTTRLLRLHYCDLKFHPQSQEVLSNPKVVNLRIQKFTRGHNTVYSQTVYCSGMVQYRHKVLLEIVMPIAQICQCFFE